MAANGKGLPYGPSYHDDFLRSTTEWKLVEGGAYMMLLLAQWEIGLLLTEPERLAAISGLKEKEMRRISRAD